MDFGKKWQHMVEIFNLDEDNWFRYLSIDRKHWVPTYVRDTFFFGMYATQRSKSVILL